MSAPTRFCIAAWAQSGCIVSTGTPSASMVLYPKWQPCPNTIALERSIVAFCSSGERTVVLPSAASAAEALKWAPR